MPSEEPVLRVGDRMRFTVKFLRDIHSLPDQQMHVVRVANIREDADGIKVIRVEVQD